MIKVRNKVLVIPENELTIAAEGDKESVNRVFEIPRVQPDGTDLANMIFKLDILYLDSNEKDRDDLGKVISDDFVTLTWTISSLTASHTGNAYIQVCAMTETGSMRWKSYQAAVYIETSISTEKTTIGLSELENMEARINQQLTTLTTAETARTEAEAARDAAETAREAAEKERQAAETGRENAFEENEKARQKTFDTNEDAREAEYAEHIADFDRDRQELKDYATESKSWAVGGTGSRTGEDTDNSEYYSKQSAAQAAAAKTSADTAAEYAKITAPDFYLDPDTGKLYMKSGVGVDFKLENGKLYWKVS